MAVAVDATGTVAVTTSTTSASNTSLTIGASATALVGIWMGNLNPSSLTMTWDSGGTNQAMTLIGSITSVTGGYIYLFGLINPTPGNKTLAASWTGSISCVLDGISFTGTATTFANAFKNFNTSSPTGTTGTLTITGASGNIQVCGACQNVNTWQSLSTTGSTQIFNDATHAACIAARAPSASSLTWTAVCNSSTTLAIAGLDVAAAAAVTVPYRRARAILAR